MMTFISDLFELVFLVFLLVAIWKYDVFDKLPYWLQITLYGSLGVSGIVDILSRWL